MKKISFNVVIVCVVFASLALASGSLSDLQIGALHSSLALALRGSLRVSCSSPFAVLFALVFALVLALSAHGLASCS